MLNPQIEQLFKVHERNLSLLLCTRLSCRSAGKALFLAKITIGCRIKYIDRVSN